MQFITQQQLSGKTTAYISLGMHVLCGDLQESSCGSAGCSAVAGHAAEVQVFQKNTKDIQSNSRTPNANLQLVQGGEMSSGEANLCPEIFLTSSIYLSHLSSPSVTKLGLPLK